MKEGNSNKSVLIGKLLLLIITLCVLITSIAVYANSVNNDDNVSSNNLVDNDDTVSSSNLEIILNENEIEFVEELPNVEFYIGAKQLFSDSTQNILDPISVVWSTSDNTIAEVKDNGAIIPKSTGVVIITAEYEGLKACSTVNIKKGEIIDLSIPKTAFILPHSLSKNGLKWPYGLELVATTTAGNKYEVSHYGDVVWKSSNANATIKKGNVFSINPGKVKISASFNGLTAEEELNFVDNKITNIRFGKKAIIHEEIYVREDIQLFADFDDGLSFDISKYADWESQNPDVAVVCEGLLISTGEGVTDIIAKYEEFICEIEVSVQKSQNTTSECAIIP